MIRPARADDIRPIVRLAIEIFGDVFPFEVDEEYAVNSLAMLMFSNGFVRVAEVDGKIVGFLVGAISLAGMWSSDLCAVEAKFGVHPEHRGSRLDRALIREFEAWAANMGVKDVAMISEADLDPRVGHYYRRLGYVPAEVIHRKRIG